MCISLIIGLVSTAVGVVGAVQQASAQKAQAEYQAAVERNNVIIANQNAADAIDRGRVEADDMRRRVNQSLGSARAAVASNGLLLDDDMSSTSATLLDDMMIAGQLDVLRIHNNAQREERRAKIQGMNFEAQARLYDQKAASISPLMAGLSAGVSGLSGLGDFIR